MAISPTVIAELRNLLRNFRAAHGLTAVPKGAGKALEAWLLIKLADEARSTGNWAVTLCRGDGMALPTGAPFVFRHQPGAIGAASPIGPGFIRIARNINPGDEVTLELHGVLQWLGRSGTRHEWDVSILPFSVGTALRNHGGGCPYGLPVVGYECKDILSPGTTDEIRQTLARLFDLAFVSQTSIGGRARIFDTPGTTRWGRRSSQYKAYFALGLFGIVRVGYFLKGARSLADHFHIHRYRDVYQNPNTVQDLLRDFRNTLARLHELL